MDAVGAVRRAGPDFVQEYDIVAPFLDSHGVARQLVEPGGEPGELVKMGGKQSATPVHIMQMLDRRPGDGEAIKCRGTASDLVKNNK